MKIPTFYSGKKVVAENRPGQSGIALVTCMLILVMLTLLAIAMFRGYGLQQKIAGNTREKERAFQAAESALQYGEYWLLQGTAGTGSTCTGAIAIRSDADMRVCTNPLQNPADPDNWAAASYYNPPAMKVNAGGGIATDGNGNLDINYAKTPALYISYLGMAPDGERRLYLVTGAGYGGSSGTTSVVQSVFATSPDAIDKSLP